MSVIRQIAEGKIDVEEVLNPQALKPLYDIALVDETSEDASLALRRHLRFMPIIEDSGKGGTVDSCVPIKDSKTPFSKYMGLLVHDSNMFDGLFVVKFYPFPRDTEYPVRILSSFGGRIHHTRFFGFIAEKGKLLHGPEVALLFSGTEGTPSIERLGFMQSRLIVAGLVIDACEKARYKNSHRLEASLNSPSSLDIT